MSQNTGMETNNFQQTNDGLCLTILFYLKWTYMHITHEVTYKCLFRTKYFIKLLNNHFFILFNIESKPIQVVRHRYTRYDYIYISPVNMIK